MRNVLIHVKNNESLEIFAKMIENQKWEQNIKYSKEVRYMIEEFIENNWNVYLTSIDNFDFNSKMWNLYNVKEKRFESKDINQVNEKIQYMIIRVIGSVEAKFKLVNDYLDFLIENYEGFTLNNLQSMKKGLTKKYLIEIDPEKLRKIGIKTIPTKIYPNTISAKELLSNYDKVDDYLIKPITGELSNSLCNLEKVSEEYLRYKENKVGGWVVQPIMSEILDGEYQMSFLNGNLIYSQKKIYSECNDKVPNQKSRTILKYNPTNAEIEIIRKLISYFSNLYNIKIEICRVDFMKDKNNEPRLLEFEMVNPGFFLGYLDEHDEAIKNVTTKIRKYLEEENI